MVCFLKQFERLLKRSIAFFKIHQDHRLPKKNYAELTCFPKEIKPAKEIDAENKP